MKERAVDRQSEVDPIEFARGVALNALSSRAKSRHELEAQLARRGVVDEVAKLVLDRLATVGLIDDREFAKSWVHSRVRSKGLSRRVLAQELRTKGVEQSIIDEMLVGISADDEYQAAFVLAAKKARGITNLSRDVQTRRIFDLLARKGFSSSMSARIIKEVLGE